MPKLDSPQSVVKRLRGHWRLSLSEPLYGRSAIVVIQRVLDDEDEARLPHRTDWCLGPESFRQLLDSLAENAQVVSLASALQQHHDSRPRIALTFDGGWQDLNRQVAPALEKLALPASVFIPHASAPHFRAPWRAVLSEALWQAEIDGEAFQAFVAAGLAPPPVGGPHRDEAASRAIRLYLEQQTLASSVQSRLESLAETLLPASGLMRQALDPFSIRRLESGGLIRFGSLSMPVPGDVHSLHRLRHSRHRLASLCQQPLDIVACASDDGDATLVQLAEKMGIQHVLTRQPGWLPPSPRHIRLPRFSITQPLASSPGKLFDWLLGYLQ
ncbi:polysaccharide deacetylase family protein [Salinicola rhizosphaerae]|uniref:Polysaccharide deacetylase n=1 Tax=Salinicola rhizosphaerae TaxID=1443141 RepID=A0ABQ3ECN1_9GAMM|nr:polysaccharide deacetylase family protein [Salinicola rhizosphaerae]GHB32178.1 hypothetical protein GCM10009038_33680 [Salinicola rhizosphaerae]